MIRRIVSLVAACALVPSLVACGASYSKETVPLARESVSARVPNQQRLLALAVDEAVERLEFKHIAGKRVMTEIAGIYPHSNVEVLSYVRGAVEGKLARSGAVVLAHAPAVVASEDDAIATGGALQLDPSVDYRVIINVSWAGVDTHTKVTTDSQLLAKQIGVGVIGGLLGVLMASQSSDLAAVGGFLTMGSIGGAIAWNRLDRPQIKSFRLMGRVRLSVEGIPLVSGKAFQSVAEGQTEIVIDPQAEEGYLLMN